MEVTTTVTTEVVAPVALYIMLDNSGSMDEDAGGAAAGQTRWEVAVESLTDFVNDPGSDGIDVALQYFQAQGVAGGGDECNGSDHSTPAVDIDRLPNAAGAFVQSLDNENPNGGTPTVGALTGAIDFCEGFQAQTPDERCIVVLVTDGQPNGCGLSSDCGGGGGGGGDCLDPLAQPMLSAIAAEGATAGIRTFTIGMAGVTVEGFALLDAIAVAGGSDCSPGAPGDEACDVSATGAAGFLEALSTIRETVTLTETITETVTETVTVNQVLPCEFAVPPPPAGETVSADLTIVTLAVNGGAEEDLTRADSAGACAGDGWYYTNPGDLTTVSACPATCDRITSATSAQVNVLLGCAPGEPRLD